MQYFKLEKVTGLIVGLVMLIAGTSTALAVGTASGTPVSNTATVNYTVGSDARSDNDTIAFIVDNRVDVTVLNQDTANNVNVAPGSTEQVLQFLVTNTGNNIQGYLLTTAAPTTDIPMDTPVSIYIDDGNNSWDGTGTETLYVAGNNAFDLDPNGAVGADDVTVYIVADTPASASDGDQDDYRLIATTTADGGVGAAAVALGASGAPTALEDVVFADGAGDSDAANDGAHSDAATYTVASAALTLTKTIVNVNDEFNGDGGFNIPNAVVRYSMVIANTGTGATDGASVVISDPIPANTLVCVDAAGSRCTATDLPTFTIGGSSILTATLQYSDDNQATWTYVPGGNTNTQGADTTVTDIRFTTTGALDAAESVTVTFGVLVQ